MVNNISYINLNKPDESNIIKITRFPDSQTQVDIINRPATYCSITVSLDSADKIMLLLQTVDVLKRYGVHTQNISLHVMYFHGARSDKSAGKGFRQSSIQAAITADLINNLKLGKVYVLDLHNTYIGLLINNYEPIDIDFRDLKRNDILEYANKVLISPDLGASKKYEQYYKEALQVAQCIKTRDSDGNITLDILNAEVCEGQDCLIKDDLIDGGGTFIAIAKALKAKNIKPKSLTLECTHGIFSAGIQELTKYFDKIKVSNSYTKIHTDVLLHRNIEIIDTSDTLNLIYR